MRTYILSAILSLATAAAFVQNAVGMKASPPSTQNNEATAAGKSSANQAKCDTAGDQEIPTTSTLEATVTGSLDSAHLKPGKEITAQVVTAVAVPRLQSPRQINSLRPHNCEQFVQKSRRLRNGVCI